MSQAFDALVVGSGPAGVHASIRLIERGLTVGLIDIGYTDQDYASQIPDAPWAELRANDPRQERYFLGGDPAESFRLQSRAGAHLTPPRQHMLHRTLSHFPTVEDGLSVLQATAQGGLAASWGANCFTYSDDELRRTGLSSLREHYEAVARDIGVSGERNCDLSPFISDFKSLQPALEPDDNALTILERYQKKRRDGSFGSAGLRLGPSQLAALTRPLDRTLGGPEVDRSAHAYRDMDFWSDHGRSVYRPTWSLRNLLPHARFTYLTGRQASQFRRLEDGRIRVSCRSAGNDGPSEFFARRLLLAGGAVNSARLVANSLDGHEFEFPLLCNPNRWVACVNWNMLGRPARDRRHSLSQLTALMPVEGPGSDFLVAHVYSYRSLLLFRLLAETSLPSFIALPALRLLLTSLTLVNVQWPGDLDAGIRLKFDRPDGDDRFRPGLLHALSRTRPSQDRLEDRSLRKLLAAFFRLGVVPMKQARPLPGASIHYAGTLPRSHTFSRFGCRPNGELWGCPGAWSADSAGWNWLPAKGLTFTIMAGARAAADQVAESLLLPPEVS